MNLEIASTVRSRLLGLRGRPDFSGVLMLVPCHDVHTFGMRQSLDIAFVAADGMVVESYKSVGPNRRLKNREAVATFERFADESPWFISGDCIQDKLGPAQAHMRRETRNP